MSARAKRWRRSARQLRFTREGRVFILVTLGVGAAAVNTGNNLLYLVLGLLLSLIVLSGVMSEQVLRGLKIRRRLPKRAFAGAPCLIELTVENEKARLPSLSIETEDVAPAEPTDRRCYFLKVGAQSEQAASYQRTPARRGVVRFTEVRVRTRYPFGLFEKGRVLDLPDELVVYPALASLPRARAELGRAGADAPTRRQGRGVEVASLRDYREGDDVRAIHWRRSASLDRLVVRERHHDAARRLTLLIDERRPPEADAGWEARFEQAISLAAATAARALDEGSSVEAVARTGSSPRVSPGQPADPVWRFLALLEPVAAAGAPELPARLAGVVRRFEVQAEVQADVQVDVQPEREPARESGAA